MLELLLTTLALSLLSEENQDETDLTGEDDDGPDFGLEMLCADQCWGEEHPAFEETLRAQARLGEMAPGFDITASLIRSDDKYSEHQDAYIYFSFSQLETAQALEKASGLNGDILDLRNSRLSPEKQVAAKLFADEAGWSLGNGW